MSDAQPPYLVDRSIPYSRRLGRFGLEVAVAFVVAAGGAVAGLPTPVAIGVGIGAGLVLGGLFVDTLASQTCENNL